MTWLWALLLRDWWVALGSVICGVLAGFSPMLRDWVIERKRQHKPSYARHSLPSQAQLDADNVRVLNWGQLTKADRAWFEYNYWNGAIVLDERGPAPDSLTVLGGQKYVNTPLCTHEHYLEIRALLDPESTRICDNCGEKC
jgi:hypothetical protein